MKCDHCDGGVHKCDTSALSAILGLTDFIVGRQYTVMLADTEDDNFNPKRIELFVS